MNKITQLFNIKYPIIQGGMIWNSGYKLASAVSNAGGLGLIGAGSMYPEVLREHIQKCKKATDKPFGVNVPMLYPNIEEIMHLLIDQPFLVVVDDEGCFTGIVTRREIMKSVNYMIHDLEKQYLVTPNPDFVDEKIGTKADLSYNDK